MRKSLDFIKRYRKRTKKNNKTRRNKTRVARRRRIRGG